MEIDPELLDEYEPIQVFENSVGDVRDVARLLRVSTKTVYRLVRSEAIPHKRVGNQIKFLIPQLLEWMKGGSK